MKTLVICLLLLASCTDIDFKKVMQGHWVNIYDFKVRLEVIDNGNKMAYRYYFTEYITDTTTDTQGNILIDTLAAPHLEEWIEAKYDEKRGFIYGVDSSRLSYLEDGDGLMLEKGMEVAIFARQKNR